MRSARGGGEQWTFASVWSCGRAGTYNAERENQRELERFARVAHATR